MGGVEIIQRHHRYVIGWPSIHDKTGLQYRWLGIDGGALQHPPSPADIPDLPPPWLAAPDREPAHNGTEFDPQDAYNVSGAITDGDMSQRVAYKLGEALSALHGPACRHDEIRNRVLGLLRCGKQGESGVKRALQALSEAFANKVGPDRPGGRGEAIHEFRSFIYRKQPDGRWVFNDNVARLLADDSYDDDTGTETGATAGQPGDGEPVDPVEKAIRRRVGELRIDHEARRRLDNENRPPLHYPPVRSASPRCSRNPTSPPATASPTSLLPTPASCSRRNTKPGSPP